jgi:hypothetical protein
VRITERAHARFPEDEVIREAFDTEETGAYAIMQDAAEEEDVVIEA